MNPIPFDAPADHEWTVTVDTDWSTDSDVLLGRQCVRRVARERCPNRAVAVLYRGYSNQPWRYCADHLYGRWIENGQVMQWTLQRSAVTA